MTDFQLVYMIGLFVLVMFGIACWFLDDAGYELPDMLMVIYLTVFWGVIISYPVVVLCIKAWM